ncbi:phage tail tape measure protein [Actinoplanes sp. NPDC048796]|uniref:phage tail tape measure protein n=1 Tax=Actinoplanes sp. NPDC048796 TaxID=3155640 RepID=UPI0033D062D7
MSVDAAKAKLTAQLGGDAAYAADMGKIAGNVYARGFGESAEAVAETLRGVLTSGLVSDDATDAEIEALTVKAQALADTFGQDVVGTARAAGQMIRNGLAKDSNEAFDILTRGFQQTGDHAGDLLDTFSEYSTQFRKLGIDGVTATGLLSQGLKGGARDADTVADALKEFSILALDGNKNTIAAFKDLGLNANQVVGDLGKGGPAAAKSLDAVLDRLRAVEDPVKRSQLAVALFGTKAEDLGDALYKLDPSTAAKGLGEVGGAADRMGQALEQSASQKLEAFKRQAQSALVEKLAAAVPYISSVASWLQQNSTYIGPLVTGLGALAIVIGTIIGVYRVWTAVQTALNIVQMASPLTWMVLGIVALIAVIVLIATKTRWFQQLWAWAWGGIKAGASAVFNWVRSNWPLLLAILTGPIGLAVLAIVRNWDKIKSGATSVKNWVVSKFAQLAGWLTSMPGKISGKLASMWDGLKSGFRSAINWVIGRWNGLSFGIPGFSIAGMSVPGVNIGTPDIPYLAKGGIVPRTPGGRLAVIGEGREDEAVAPLSKLAAMIGGSGRTVLELRSSGDRLTSLLLEILRLAIKDKGGSVQTVLGTGRG